jgi:hypothetical protein
MFLWRCIAVVLAFFFVAYGTLSCAVAAGWRAFAPRSVLSANALLWLRLGPFFAAALLSLAFTMPSFLLLEPRSSSEPIGLVAGLLAVACLALLAVGAVRAWFAMARASRALGLWLRDSSLMGGPDGVPVFAVGPDAPVLTVAGVFRPQVLVSQAALSALTKAEMDACLSHERAHVRRFDNLKKLLLLLSPFPAMRDLERAWTEAAEIEADDAAVSSQEGALDLASALLKLSRMSLHPLLPLTSGMAHGPADLVRTRVERLFAWREVPRRRSQDRGFGVPSLTIIVLLFAYAYPTALGAVHQLTEWLVQ